MTPLEAITEIRRLDASNAKTAVDIEQRLSDMRAVMRFANSHGVWRSVSRALDREQARLQAAVDMCSARTETIRELTEILEAAVPPIH